ncbi:MAG: dihydroneopterin aldolase [Bacteroidales bacterium]|jgi:dihydroneopterin aldolase|nr:dihydroneopterin aldolase [Bacteroidales bacterium]
MTSQLLINGMEFYAFHGCFKEEKIIGTRFKVDVSLEYDCQEAAQNDDLSKTINYQTVHQLVEKIMKKPANIIEHLSYKIIQSLQQNFPELQKTEVTVYKLNPAIGGKADWVAVKIQG